MSDVLAAPKSFSWSFSRLKAYEDCPRRYHETQVKKDDSGGPLWPEEPSDILIFGDEVHKAMAVALRTETALPTKFKQYQQWIDKVHRTEGELLVENECQWAITREMLPCAWFAKNVWLRTVADAVKIDTPVALVVDWKTGKSLNGDPVQLMLTSLMTLIQFPDIQCVRSDFVWLQEDSQSTQVVYRHEAADHWKEIMPRVARLENAVITDNFPPIPEPVLPAVVPGQKLRVLREITMPNVRSDDPQTSYDAFEAVMPRITDMHRRFIAILDRNGLYGVTPWELQRETGIIYNTVWRRLSELKDLDLVANTENTRPNDRAFQETVVVLRELIPDGAYIPPRGTKSRLQRENNWLRKENERLRQLLEEKENQ